LTSKLLISYQFFITLEKAKEGQHRIGLKEKKIHAPISGIVDKIT
jgi:hypothetical protein